MKKVAERKKYRELKQDILNSMDINHSNLEKETVVSNEVSLFEVDIKNTDLQINENSLVVFDLQYSYYSGMDYSTGCGSTGSKSIEIQVKEVYDREGNIFELKDNQKHEIEKLLEEKVEI